MACSNLPFHSQPPLSLNIHRHRWRLINSNTVAKHAAVRCVAVETREVIIPNSTVDQKCAPVASKTILPSTRCDSRRVSLASTWREIQGSNDWRGLIDPLSDILRNEVIRYGELVRACYKAFDLNPTSRRFLNCKHGKATMFQEVGMGSPGYEITRYIYAAPGISVPAQQADAGRSRWIGYVAVSTDEETMRIGRRDIFVSFRGTVTRTEWLANLMSTLTPARFDPINQLPDVKVESGFLSLYTSSDSTCRFGQGSCREQLLREVARLLNQYKGEELSVTLAGHSMGSSLAILFGYDLTELRLNRASPGRVIPVTVYSFGGPRVGNSKFKQRCHDVGLKVLRVVNTCDPVTKLPGMIMNEGIVQVIGRRYEMPWRDSCYAHVGVELCLDFFRLENPTCVHDMDTYMRLLDLNGSSMADDDDHDENGELGFLEKAKGMVARGYERVDVHVYGWQWQWHDAALKVGDLVQSLGF